MTTPEGIDPDLVEAPCCLVRDHDDALLEHARGVLDVNVARSPWRLGGRTVRRVGGNPVAVTRTLHRATIRVAVEPYRRISATLRALRRVALRIELPLAALEGGDAFADDPARDPDDFMRMLDEAVGTASSLISVALVPLHDRQAVSLAELHAASILGALLGAPAGTGHHARSPWSPTCFGTEPPTTVPAAWDEAFAATVPPVFAIARPTRTGQPLNLSFEQTGCPTGATDPVEAMRIARELGIEPPQGRIR